MIPYILTVIFLAFSIFSSIYILNFNSESNIISSHLIKLTLNLISFFPILSLLFSAIFICEFFFTIVNNIVFIFFTSKLIALRISYLMITSLSFYRIVTISFILLSIINLKSFIKNRLMI